jgi:hypothetical protein
VVGVEVGCERWTECKRWVFGVDVGVDVGMDVGRPLETRSSYLH